VKPETFSKKILTDTPEGVRTNQDHCTPRYLVDAIEDFGGGSILCDPCSNPWSTVNAKIEYSKRNDQDGLTADWPPSGLIYINPPFGDIRPWVERCNLHYRSYGNAEIIMVAPFAPERAWFKAAWVANRTAACWPRRVAWEGSGASPPFATVIFYWGARRSEFWRWAMDYDCVLFAKPRPRRLEASTKLDLRQMEMFDE
jgi:hypothetical protein